MPRGGTRTSFRLEMHPAFLLAGAPVAGAPVAAQAGCCRPSADASGSNDRMRRCTATPLLRPGSQVIEQSAALARACTEQARKPTAGATPRRRPCADCAWCAACKPIRSGPTRPCRAGEARAARLCPDSGPARTVRRARPPAICRPAGLRRREVGHGDVEIAGLGKLDATPPTASGQSSG